MKNSMMLSAALLMMVSCQKEDTPYGAAPDSIEQITLSSSDIRPEQTITAAVVLPSGGENILKTEYQWKLDDGLVYEPNEIKDGKAFFAFYAPTTPGTHTVYFTARYIFTNPDKNGNAYKDLTTSLQFSVKECDIFRSLWSDDIATTLTIYPELTKYDETVKI